MSNSTLKKSVEVDLYVKVKHNLHMLIGELAKQSNTSARSIRHYEKLGLLKLRRSHNGYRHYPSDAIRHLEAIRHLLLSGISLRIMLASFRPS